MRCPSCGVEAFGDAKFCPRCGYSFDQRTMMPFHRYILSQPQRTGWWTTGRIVTVIIIFLIVVPVVLSAILYVMVLGFGGTSESAPSALYAKEAVADGWRITIVAITRPNVAWDEVRVHLTDGADFAAWNPSSTDLDDGMATTAPYGSRPLGALSVTLTVTDVGGNGVVSGSDYFTLTTTSFNPSMTYTAFLLYMDTGERIGTGISFPD